MSAFLFANDGAGTAERGRHGIDANQKQESQRIATRMLKRGTTGSRAGKVALAFGSH